MKNITLFLALIFGIFYPITHANSAPNQCHPNPQRFDDQTAITALPKIILSSIQHRSVRADFAQSVGVK